MKRFTKTMAALGLAAVMGTGSAFISLADVTTSVNPVATSRKSGWVDVQNHWYYFDANGNPVKNQWIQDGNNRYWMQEDGEMAKQKWILRSRFERTLRIVTDKDYFTVPASGTTFCTHQVVFS